MPTSSDGPSIVFHPADERAISKRGMSGKLVLSPNNASSKHLSAPRINVTEPFSPFIPDNGKSPTTRRAVYIWSVIDISGLPPTTQFIIIASGVLTFFIGYGYLQEKITGTFKQDKVHLGWYMTSVQFAVYTCFTFMQTSLTKRTDHASAQHEDFRGPRPPLRAYALIGTLSVLSMGLSNTSCEYLNYPTQVMFKCSKLIPVMIVGVFMLKKKYKAPEYIASALISFGLINLSLADHQSSVNFDYRGILPITLSLCAGAFIGNFQEKLYREYCPTEGEMIFYTKGCGFLGLLLIIVFTGQLQLGLQYSMEKPVILANIVMLALAGVLGEYFIMLMTRLFGALATVTTTSCRKALTLYLSFILFPKPFNYKYLVACASIFLGIFLNVYSKNQTQVQDTLRPVWRWLQHQMMRRAVRHREAHSPEDIV